MKKNGKMDFLKKVSDTIKQYDMVHKGDRVLVAVSGGADSVCLLIALAELKKEKGIQIVAANMDHCLRGKESESDSAFVKELASHLGVECIHKKVNVASSGKKGTSTEEKARQKRYEFFAESAKAGECGVIATGHTLDDQAETVVMRFISGSSLAGITGIPPVREEKGLKVIRPLIRIQRKEIIAFLKEMDASYVEDSSNADMKFLRNRIRKEVLPFLEGFNPRIKRAMANLSDTLREDLEFIEFERKKADIPECDAGVRVKVKDLILQPVALRKQVFKELFTRAGGNVKKLTYRHWMDMDGFLRSAEKSSSLDLPGEVRVTKKGDSLMFAKRPKKARGKAR